MLTLDRRARLGMSVIMVTALALATAADGRDRGPRERGPARVPSLAATPEGRPAPRPVAAPPSPSLGVAAAIAGAARPFSAARPRPGPPPGTWIVDPGTARPGPGRERGVLAFTAPEGVFLMRRGERVMLRLDRGRGPAPAAGALGAGDLFSAAVLPIPSEPAPPPPEPAPPGGGAGDAGVADGDIDDGIVFDGPADPPGPFIRPGCPTTGTDCQIVPPLAPARNVAEGLADELPPLDDLVPREAVIVRAMERLGLYVRAISRAELLDATAGCRLLDDTPDRAEPAPAERATVAHRLRRESVLAVLEQFESLFVLGGAGAAPRGADHGRHIRTVMAEAWADFAARAGEAGPDPAGFRSFVATAANQAEALAYVNGLRALFEELSILGITPAEMRRARRAVLEPVTPEELSVTDVEDMLGLPSVG